MALSEMINDLCTRLNRSGGNIDSISFMVICDSTIGSPRRYIFT